MPKFGMSIYKMQRYLARFKYNFDIEVKGQGHSEFMNVHDTSTMVIHSRAK